MPSQSIIGQPAEQDCRGLDPAYMRNEASKSFYLCITFLVVAVNGSYFAAWLAFNGSYLAAIALSVPSSVLWRNAISEACRSTRLHIAANLADAD